MRAVIPSAKVSPSETPYNDNVYVKIGSLPTYPKSPNMTNHRTSYFAIVIRYFQKKKLNQKITSQRPTSLKQFLARQVTVHNSLVHDELGDKTNFQSQY